MHPVTSPSRAARSSRTRAEYDHVMSIFSAAVICEDPHLFGFDVECPSLVEGAAGTDGSGM